MFWLSSHRSKLAVLIYPACQPIASGTILDQTDSHLESSERKMKEQETLLLTLSYKPKQVRKADSEGAGGKTPKHTHLVINFLQILL